MVLVLLKELLPLVPNEPDVTAPLLPMFWMYPIAPLVVNDTVAELAFVDQLTDADIPKDCDMLPDANVTIREELAFVPVDTREYKARVLDTPTEPVPDVALPPDTEPLNDIVDDN